MIFSAFPSLSPSFLPPVAIAGILAVVSLLYTMLRRFSTNFKKPKGNKEERREAKENGSYGHSKRHSMVAPIRKSTTSPPVAEEDEHAPAATRETVRSAFERHAQVIHASQTPMPRQTGDATFLEHDTTSGLFGDIKALGFRDVGTLKDLISSKASGELVDDKTMLMERIIQVCDISFVFPCCHIQVLNLLCSSSVVCPKARRTVSNSQTSSLTSSGARCLTRPCRKFGSSAGYSRKETEWCRFMGEDYAYRSADGSNNNPTLPWLGAANTPYSRSIAPLTVQPTGLPDAGLVFDSVFAREEFTPHPNKVSSVFFDWASLVIHGKLSFKYWHGMHANLRRHLPNRLPQP